MRRLLKQKAGTFTAVYEDIDKQINMRFLGTERDETEEHPARTKLLLNDYFNCLLSLQKKASQRNEAQPEKITVVLDKEHDGENVKVASSLPICYKYTKKGKRSKIK